jgi:hypothetical protein
LQNKAKILSIENCGKLGMKTKEGTCGLREYRKERNGSKERKKLFAPFEILCALCDTPLFLFDFSAEIMTIMKISDPVLKKSPTLKAGFSSRPA